MGQTNVGSYIVTAYAPAEVKVPIRSTKDEGEMDIEHVNVASGRAVTNAVAEALTATVEAVGSARKSQSTSPFEDAVDHGVSYELLVAVRDLATGSDGADITIEWDTSPLLPELTPQPRTFEFRGSDVPLLDRAATQLATPEPPRRVVISGRVHLLSRKEPGGPGVFGVQDGKRSYRVRLADETRHDIAVQAYGEQKLVQVTGELSREGGLSWVYDASVRVLEPAEAAPNLEGPTSFTEQRLFDES